MRVFFKKLNGYIFVLYLYYMNKNELKDLIKECLQEVATSENFITFTISGGYNFETSPPAESKFTLSVGSAKDLIDLLNRSNNPSIVKLSSELKKHTP